MIETEAVRRAVARCWPSAAARAVVADSLAGAPVVVAAAGAFAVALADAAIVVVPGL